MKNLKNMFTALLLVLVITLCLVRWNDRKEYLSTVQVQYNEIEAYKDQVRTIKLHSDSLENKINSKTAQVDVVNVIANQKKEDVQTEKKNLNAANKKKYNTLPDSSITAILSNTQFNTND